MAAPRHWRHDPVVGLGVLVAVASTAAVLFAGRYLPYDDWAGHVGLASVLATGAQTGADAWLSRSLTPSPYMLFYLATAGWAAVGLAEVGAKLNLLFAAALLVIGGARLAEAAGRDPRRALLMPLGLFGVALGSGFSSYLFAMPWLLFALADLEGLLFSAGRDRAEARRRTGGLAVALVLTFLGHGLIFVFCALLVAARLLAHALPRLRAPRELAPVAGRVALAALPTTLVALPSLARRLAQPWVAPEFQQAGLPGFTSLEAHLASFGPDLLDRGGRGHGLTAILVGLVLLAWWRFGARPSPPNPRAATIGPPLYFGLMLVLFVAGPAHFGWPVTFWGVYTRAGSLALMLLFLLPTRALAGPRGAKLAALAFVPLVHNAAVNAPVVAGFSAWAAPFDAVRQAIRAGQRVLPLILPKSLGPAPRAGYSLPFYLLVDGAAYVPVANVPEEVPVHRRPGAPVPARQHPRRFDLEQAAEDYDYLITRGEPLVEAAQRSPAFVEVTRAEGWVVFTSSGAEPPPRPTN